MSRWRRSWRDWVRVAGDVMIGALCFTYAREEPLLLLGFLFALVNLYFDAREGR